MTQGKTAYVAVDAQYDFLEGGALGVNGGTAAVERLADHLTTVAYDVVVTTQDWHIDPGTHWSAEPDFTDTWPVHCEADTHGAALFTDVERAVENLTAETEYSQILKGQYTASYSGFDGATVEGESLVDLLRDKGVTTVHIGGVATDYCVRATVLDALSAGFTVVLHTDHIAAVADETGAAALIEVSDAGATLTNDEEN